MAINEKEIQKDIARYITEKTGYFVIEEEFKNLGVAFKEHQYLLVSPYKNYFKGLKYHIENLNTDIYSKYSHLPRKDITDAIYNSFVSKYNSYNHINIYKLVFHTLSQSTDRLVKLIDKNGLEKEESYNVVSFNDINKNEFTIIKEKRIELNGSWQLPDFAIYINGIPLYSIEVKTEKAGLNKAHIDYQTKESYKKFIACIGTDGSSAFISFMPNSSTFFQWQAYGENKNSNNKNEFEDLMSDLFFNKEQALFYLQYSVSVEKDITGEVLVNHRCQQFYTLKKLDTLFQNATKNNKKEFRKVIKHVQRSGKSLTIKSTVNLLSRKYPNLFKKIYICVPDTVISRGIEGTFGDLKLSTGKQIKKIENRDEYNNSISITNKSIEVYLMNIQKVDISKNENEIYKHDDVLIIIDEVHTHQTGKSAEIRNKNFPKASMLTFTATPRMINNKSILRNITKAIYSDDNSYLDEFKASDALNLGIVLPIVYEKAKYQQVWEQDKVIELDIAQIQSIEKFAKESIDLKSTIDKKVEEEIKKLDSLYDAGEIKQSSYSQKIEKIEEEVIKSEKAKLSQLITQNNIREIKENCISHKINFITDDVINKRKQSFSKVDGSLYFKTKSFWIVEDVSMARLIMQKIDNLSNSNELNKINGVRFAVDFSENIKDVQSDDGLFDANNSYLSKKQLNKKIVYGNDIIDDFESESEDSVDVLIIVGKYLMGYDESKLVTVYIDTTINEPSRLYQLITRPATARKNKKLGYVCDLTWTERNYQTFKTALEYYDSNENINSREFILTDEIIKEQVDKVEKSLLVMINILGFNLITDFNHKNKSQLYKNLISLKQSKQQEYFNEFSKIMFAIDILISPNYYIPYMKEIYLIMLINDDYYQNILYKPTEIVYSPALIKNIIIDSYKTVNINSINDIVEYKLTHINPRQFMEINQEEEYNQKIAELSIRIRQQKRYATKTMWEKMIEMQEELKKSTIEEAKSKELLELLTKTSEQTKNEVKFIISDQFNNNSYHYLTHKVLKNDLEKVIGNLDSELEYIVDSYSKSISEDFYRQLFNTDNLNDIIFDLDLIKIMSSHEELWFKNTANKNNTNKEKRKVFHIKFRKTEFLNETLIKIAEQIRKELNSGDLSV